jgi:uncharacterized repeat protein (TIGR02543 family)
LPETGSDSFNIPVEFTVTTADGHPVDLKITLTLNVECADLLKITLQMDAADLDPGTLASRLSKLDELKELISDECATFEFKQLTEDATTSINEAVSGAMADILHAKGLELKQIQTTCPTIRPDGTTDENAADGNIFRLLDDAAQFGLLSATEVDEFAGAIDPGDISAELEAKLGNLRRDLQAKYKAAFNDVPPDGETATTIRGGLRDWLLQSIDDMEDDDAVEPTAPETPAEPLEATEPTAELSAAAAGSPEAKERQPAKRRSFSFPLRRPKLSGSVAIILTICLIITAFSAWFTFSNINNQPPEEHLMLAASTPQYGGQIQPSFGSYENGELVPMQAIPSRGYRFVSWGGDVTGSEPIIRVNIEQNLDIVANFEALPEHQLKIAVIPAAGGTISPENNTYYQDEIVTLTATPTPGYEFTGWSGDVTGSDPSAGIQIDGDKQVTASFATASYRLEVIPQPLASAGTVNIDGGDYGYGSNVTLKAVASRSYEFSGWSGDITGSDPVIATVITADTMVFANFTICQQQLATSTSPADSGYIRPLKTTYNYGDKVTVTATAFAGYQFSHWDGDAAGRDPKIQLTMNADKTIRACFTPRSYTLTTTVNPTVTVTVSPSERTYAHDSAVTLTAEAIQGYRFLNWSGGANNTSPQTTITMDDDKTVTANFEPMTQVLAYPMASSNSTVQSWITYRKRLNAGETLSANISISSANYSDDTSYGWGITLTDTNSYTLYDWSGTRVDNPTHCFEHVADSTAVFTLKVYHWSAYSKDITIYIKPSEWVMTHHLP